eukprot:g7665.t1
MRETLWEAVQGLSRDQVFNVCGAVGGLLLAGAQIPQIYHVTSRQRALDVSYAYQFIFAIGLIMFLIYYSYHQRWAVFAPSCLSFVCVCYLIGLKTYVDVLKPKRRVGMGLNDQVLGDDDLGTAGAGGDGLDQPLLGGEAESKQDEFIAYPALVS